jgi:imidazole glycerol-phosphate synthase subunit HisH
MKVGIINYGMGNLRSVYNAVKVLGTRAVVSEKAEELLACDSLILPGVGAFSSGIKLLKRLNLDDVIYEFVLKEKPFLGICLGMQLMFTDSQENGMQDGLNIFPGHVVNMRTSSNKHLRIPHIGWNDVNFNQPLIKNCDGDMSFYFVHSFKVVPDNSDIIASVTDYGGEFVSAVKFNNITATQFHPEKSQKKGLLLLENWLGGKNF